LDNETPEVITEAPANKVELASRWQRLWASLIDVLTILLITVPAMLLTSGFSGIAAGSEPSFIYNLFIGLLGLSFFFFINRKLLAEHGQTIGKMVLGIKIVDLDGNLPGVTQHLLPRYATFLLPGYVPVVGQYFALINVLFIFTEDKRCIHDHIAKTRVVACKRKGPDEASINA